MKRVWVVAIAVVAVLLVGGAAAAWVVLGALTPEEAVAQVVEKLETAESYRFTMDGTIESSGQSMSIQFEGLAQEGEELTDSRLRMDGSIGLLGQSIGMSEIMLDGKVYLKYDQDPFGAAGQWYWMDYDLTGVQSAQYGNPSDYLQYMEAYSAIEKRDDETIDGVECSHYYLTIDPDKLADISVENYELLAEQMPESVATEVDAAELRAIYAGSTITVDLFIDKDSGMPRRQALWLELGGAVPASFDITIDLFDFNEPVTIEAPEGAIPLPVALDGTGQ